MRRFERLTSSHVGPGAARGSRSAVPVRRGWRLLLSAQDEHPASVVAGLEREQIGTVAEKGPQCVNRYLSSLEQRLGCILPRYRAISVHQSLRMAYTLLARRRSSSRSL